MDEVSVDNRWAGSRPIMLKERSPEMVKQLNDAVGGIAPMAMSHKQRFDVAVAVSRLLPEGLQRGSTLGVRGPAAISVAFAVAAGPVATGSWIAMIGCDDFGLVAAEQLGMPLHRMIMVAQPTHALWAAVAAALVDGFDVLMLANSYSIGLRDARRLLSRTRERGGVIIDTTQCWPEAHDVVLEVTSQQWVGLGDGHGMLKARQVNIEVSGRRGERLRTVPLWLPGSQGIPQLLDHAHIGTCLIDHTRTTPQFSRSAPFGND